jgi:polysaccharide pyruvyl transferase WcaK-like protein
MTITLWPHGGSANHGCEAIVRATKLILGDAKLDLFTAAIAEDQLYGLDECCTLHRATTQAKRFSPAWLAAHLSRDPQKRSERLDALAFSPVVSSARRNGIMLSIGGDNYCYGINRHMLLVNRLVRQTGARTVLWGCSIEPDTMTHPETRADLAAFDVIVARESITRDMLLAAGFKRVALRPDPAFALERRDATLPDGIGENNSVGINLSPLIIQREKSAGATMASYERLIGHILNSSDMSVALVPHVVRRDNNDNDPLRQLCNKFSPTGRVAMIPDSPAPLLKGAIARCRFFVAARTHASIAAYSSQVPTLAVGYSVKARGFARDIFGTEQGHVVPVESLRGGSELVDAFEHMRRNENAIRRHFETMMPEYIDSASRSYELL